MASNASAVMAMRMIKSTWRRSAAARRLFRAERSPSFRSRQAVRLDRRAYPFGSSPALRRGVVLILSREAVDLAFEVKKRRG